MVGTFSTSMQTCRVSLAAAQTRHIDSRQLTKNNTTHNRSRRCLLPPASSHREEQNTQLQALSRRHLAQQTLLFAALAAALPVNEAHAIGFKKELKKKKIPIEDYLDLPNGLKYYDTLVGNGKEISAGTDVTVHFDCIFRGIDVVSSRSARLLGGNRTIAEPYEFIAGEPVSAKKIKSMGDSAGGLFSGTGGPKPPPALSSAVIGMKVGGKRSVIVSPELGYGTLGEQEIGPGDTFELRIEVLSVA